jgi:hypothetical protein
MNVGPATLTRAGSASVCDPYAPIYEPYMSHVTTKAHMWSGDTPLHLSPDRLLKLKLNRRAPARHSVKRIPFRPRKETNRIRASRTDPLATVHMHPIEDKVPPATVPRGPRRSPMKGRWRFYIQVALQHVACALRRMCLCKDSAHLQAVAHRRMRQERPKVVETHITHQIQGDVLVHKGLPVLGQGCMLRFGQELRN